MIRKTKYNKKFSNKSYIPGEYDVRDRQDAGIPMKEDSTINTTLNGMAFKDLSFAKPITVIANPTAEATKAAVPYAIINNTNRVVDAKYPGSSNFAGNTMPLLTNSANSKLLNTFDVAKLALEVNYLYAAIKENDINQALNVQYGKSMTEALSKAYSETYINLPLWAASTTIESSMKNCDVNNRTQVFFWYQTMLQNIATIPAKYNLLVSLEQHLKDCCYNRDVAPLDDLFGLLRKNSFRAKINAFSNHITGEYFDIGWFKQINTLTMVPSRKTNSMQDPLLIIDAVHKVPSLIIKYSDVEVLNSDQFKVNLPTSAGELSGLQDFDVAIAYCISCLSPYNVLTWARQYTQGLSTVTPLAYFNNISNTIDAIRNSLAGFPSAVADIRTVLDVANRANLNRWVRGIYFDVTKEMNYQPVFNKLVNDIFVNYLASPDKITYDLTTLRWKYFVLWDKYLGIPAYDRRNGGSFLTFSTRNFDDIITPSTDTQYLIPKLFKVSAADTCFASNRLGISIDMTYKVFTNTEVNEDQIFTRLNPLGYTDFDLRVPTVNITSGYTDISTIGSSIFQFINNLFGIGQIEVEDNVFNKTLSSDLICAVDIELDDVSNNMIAFAQAYAPFKVYAPIKERTIGFSDNPAPMF